MKTFGILRSHLRWLDEKGFTLAEILIVVGVLVIISGLTFASFSELGRREALDKDALAVQSLLNEARSLTLSSKNSTKYGVYFQSDSVTLFEGETYSEGNPGNKRVALNPAVSMNSIVLSGGGSAVVFERLTGKTLQQGTTTLVLKSDSNKKKDIVIFSTGVAEIR